MGQTVALPVLRGKNTSDPACNLLVAVQANMVMSAGKSLMMPNGVSTQPVAS